MKFIQEIVKGDSLFEEIVNLITKYQPKTILEIGSANGLGSTQAIIQGIKINNIENQCQVYCIEACIDRFYSLMENTTEYKYINCINASSLSVDEYMMPSKIKYFMARKKLHFNIHKNYTEDTVLKWREDEIRNVVKSMIPQNGIYQAYQYNAGNLFDMVIIDGSAFTAMAEVRQLFGSKLIILNDVLDIKSWEPTCNLLISNCYKVINKNDDYRNGFAAFELRDELKSLMHIKNGLNQCG
jgi:hypothetical protein